ncbi:myo-inositol-1(or 4)-monophosphatase [Paraburkholderia sp. BL6669N2]|uniref:inositol monophosphatase family protein n=1 Tax=Paraburkholderia sp. BL6669N2 TaxID=1938807 RepID=UPI000E25D0B3|nr:inositol monophosphatase family protein [Paraburkholderia sp. BL6669N2]REG58605.1 myo-inositol-1(or 4)-monophosphatase [Paraburkholderia sp. BL6669N2]
MLSNLESRLQTAISIIEEAGTTALAFFKERQALAASSKGPMDFVSEADMSVEQWIREHIASAWPDDAVVGEELGGEMASQFWIVDPIDGTANFLRGSPLWGIALAFVADGEPEVGVIHYPVLHMTLAAATGEGMIVNGQPFARSVPFPDIRVAAIGTNVHWDTAETAMLEAGMKQHQWAVTGYRCATIGLGFAALGYVDGYFECHTSFWDLAAGAVLCREAGLQVAFDGERVRHGMRIAVGTSPLMDAVRPFWSALAA